MRKPGLTFGRHREAEMGTRERERGRGTGTRTQEPGRRYQGAGTKYQKRKPSACTLFEQRQQVPVAFFVHLVIGNETEGGAVDAVTRAVGRFMVAGEHMP